MSDARLSAHSPFEQIRQSPENTAIRSPVPQACTINTFAFHPALWVLVTIKVNV